MCVHKMLNHGLIHGFFLSLFKLKPCPMHWIVCVLAYLNFIFEFRAVLVLPKTAGSAQTCRSMSFIWIVWSTLYVYLWIPPKKLRCTVVKFFLRGLEMIELCCSYWNIVPQVFCTKKRYLKRYPIEIYLYFFSHY